MICLQILQVAQDGRCHLGHDESSHVCACVDVVFHCGLQSLGAVNIFLVVRASIHQTGIVV